MEYNIDLEEIYPSKNKKGLNEGVYEEKKEKLISKCEAELFFQHSHFMAWSQVNQLLVGTSFSFFSQELL